MNGERKIHFGPAVENSDRSKRDYFEQVAFRYLPQMRLVFRGGQLWSKDKWRNVAEHCLAGVAAAEVLAEALDLPEEDRAKLLKTIACHDWEKRREKFPDQFDSEEGAAVDELIKAAGLDSESLRRVMGPQANGRESELSFAERVQRYVDDIIQGSEIVSPERRIHELSQRRGDLSRDPEFAGYEGDLAGFWDRELDGALKTQREIFALLKEKGFNISSPDEVPGFIKDRISEKIVSGK